MLHNGSESDLYGMTSAEDPSEAAEVSHNRLCINVKSQINNVIHATT